MKFSESFPRIFFIHHHKMRLYTRQILLFFFLLCTFFFVSAQENYRVLNWNIGQGLSNGFVRCMLKDKYGFLWIGTQSGLNRFDGNSFKVFLPDENNHSGLLNKNIRGLVEDSLHNIWIGSDEGLSRYDINYDSFTNFFPLVDTSGANTSIIPFWSTKDKIFCLEAFSKITVFDIHSLKRLGFVQVTHPVQPNPRNLDMVYEEKSNSVWRIAEEGGLYQLDLSSGKEYSFDWVSSKNLAIHDHSAEGMCYDRLRNCFWINSGEGLMQFTLADKQFHFIGAVKKFHNRGVSIAVDTHNRIWVGTGNKGVFIYNPSTNEIHVPFQDDSLLSQKVNNMNMRIYCDRDEMTWIVYWTQMGLGINQLIPYSVAVKRYSYDPKDPKSVMTNGVQSFLEKDKEGNVYACVESELNIFNPRTAKIKRIDRTNIKGINQKNVFDFMAVGNNCRKAWLVNDDTKELFQLDIPTMKCSKVKIFDVENHDIGDVQVLGEYASFLVRKFRGDILFWAKTKGEKQSIFIFDNDSAVAREVIKLPDIDVKKIIVDDDHIIVKQTNRLPANLSFTYKNGKFIRTQIPLDSMAWSFVCYNKNDSSWWISRDRNFIQYKNDFREVHIYSAENELTAGTDIYGIAMDNNNNLWFNTHQELGCLYPKTGKIIFLSQKDGFDSQQYVFAAFPIKDNYGNFHIGGYQGFDYIVPSRLRESYPPSSVYLKSIAINQKKISLPVGINNLTELSLNYSENTISIETGIIDYYSKGASRIRYKLEGINDQWQYAPYYYTLRYEQLPAKKYWLVIQASNAVGEFNGPQKMILININPPFWNSWWFRIIAVLCGVALISVFNHYRSRKLKKRNLQLEEKVIQRTSELEHSLKELRETQTQLVQREKMASLGELTAGIAHEIQNPLNFVNNFSEVSNELVDELIEEENKTERDSKQIGHLLELIGDNLKKINQHGKRADGIVKNMLQHSRSSTGQKEFTDLNDLCDEYIKLSYHGLRAKDNSFHAIIETNFDQSIGKVKIIPQEIGRVLLNILNNAYYAITKKEEKMNNGYIPKVSIHTKKTENKIEIHIRDNGEGIPQKIIDKIYQPFFTTKPTGEGTGLGLSLSYDIIAKMHNGNINIETKEGEYSEFIIQLPA